MHVTTVRGRQYEKLLTRKFNGQKKFETKISRITVVRYVRVHSSAQDDPSGG